MPADLQDFEVAPPDLQGRVDGLRVVDVDPGGVGAEGDKDGVVLAGELGAYDGQRVVL
ncbi:hypothetical protein [Streptomyces sp. NPDC002851]